MQFKYFKIKNNHVSGLCYGCLKNGGETSLLFIESFETKIFLHMTKNCAKIEFIKTKTVQKGRYFLFTKDTDNHMKKCVIFNTRFKKRGIIILTDMCISICLWHRSA